MEEEETLAALAYLTGSRPLPTTAQADPYPVLAEFNQAQADYRDWQARQQPPEHAQARSALAPAPWPDFRKGQRVWLRLRVVDRTPYTSGWGAAMRVKFVELDSGVTVVWWCHAAQFPDLDRTYFVAATVKEVQPKAVVITRAQALTSRYGRKTTWAAGALPEAEE